MGVANVARSAAFYDAEYPVFWIDRFHPHGLKQHTAFMAKSCAEVDAFHAAALKSGGVDNGQPGFRNKLHGYPPGYYADEYDAPPEHYYPPSRSRRRPVDADQLAETTMDPRHRTLRRITVDSAESAASVFELLMGSDVAPRKEFLVAGAYEVDADAIDA